MNKFKIGDVSKILQISPELIRYYEKIGLIKPHRDPENGYRYYNLAEVNRLFDSRWLRGYGYSLEHLSKTLYENEREEFEEGLSDRLEELKKQVVYYTNLVESFEKFKNKVESLDSRIEFKRCTCPDILFIPYKVNDEYILAKDDISELKRWAAMVPFANLSFRMDKSEDTFKDLPYGLTIGFSLSSEDAEKLDFKCDHRRVQRIPAAYGIYTTFVASEEDDFLTVVNGIVDEAEVRGFSVTGSPFGGRIAQFRESGALKRYFEIWIPVQDQTK